MTVLYRSERELKRMLRSGEITVSVYGLGHVGAPILAAWLLAGAKGIGVDIDEEKVSRLERGESPIEEPCLYDVFRRAKEEGMLTATADGIRASAESDIKIIAVPSFIREDDEPDLSAIEAAASSIARGLKKGDLVILESSVPPGTTRSVLKPILESSGLKAGPDFGLAYSPERISEGRALRDIVESYPKIVGGVDERSTRVAAALYSVIAKKGVIEVSNDLVAEFEKLAEGVYRDVNIALANELAELSRELGIDYDEVRMAANSQPYSHLHRPGTGVGGLCIPIYPRFLIWKARFVDVNLTLTGTARSINEDMPRRIAELVRVGIRKLGIGNPSVIILGLAFRGDVPDSRLSPTYDLVKMLKKADIPVLGVHDPLIMSDRLLSSMDVPLIRDLREALEAANIAVISTDHSIYRMFTSEIFELGPRLTLVVDGRHTLRVDHVPEGRAYVGVGRPWVIGRASRTTT